MDDGVVRRVEQILTRGCAHRQQQHAMPGLVVSQRGDRLLGKGSPGTHGPLLDPQVPVGVAQHGIEEGHHSLSHDPDLNEPTQEKLIKINVWFYITLIPLTHVANITLPTK